MKIQRLRFVLFFAINLVLLAACQSACEHPVADGYARYIPTEGSFELGFDYPADWKMNPDRSLQKANLSGQDLSALVEFHSAPAVKYPHLVSEGHMISAQDWGNPFPGHAMKIESKNVIIDGYHGLTVAFDFDAPITLTDGTSPVTSWGYMQFTFIVVNDTIYDIRFYASTEQEKLLLKEFGKLVKSICLLPVSRPTDD